MVRTDHGVDQAVVERERARGGSRSDAELGEDVLEMPGDCVLADYESLADLLVAEAARQQSQHLDFSGGQAVPVTRRSAELLEGGQVG